jgi:putative IMPACT (imprinted ancient) family translation regulator
LGEIAYLAKNEDKSAKISIRGDEVLVDEVPRKDELRPPIAEEILMRTNDEELNMESVYFYTSKVKTVLRSQFQLHAAKVENMTMADNAYKAIHRYRNAAAATHLISAHRMQNGQVGWRDDGDHAMGRHLYSAMKNSKITNMVFFLTRNYGGVHIGKRRFEITTELVDDMIQIMQQEDREAAEKAERKDEDGYDASDKQEEQPVTTTLDDLAWDANAAISRARYDNADRYRSDFYFDNNLVECRYEEEAKEDKSASRDQSNDTATDNENEVVMSQADTNEDDTVKEEA